MDSIYEEEYKGYTIKIFQDTDPLNPRTDWDHCDTMVCFHRRYNLGDKHDWKDSFNSWQELAEQIEKDFKPVVMLPLYLYDHSGITISTGPFSCPWDSGQVGFIFMSREEALKNWSRKRVTKKLQDRIEKFLESSVKEYDDYLTGNVYGFEITKDGEDIESCWGFFGDYEKNVLLEARSIVDAKTKDK